MPLNWSPEEKSEWGLVKRFKEGLSEFLQQAPNSKGFLTRIRNYYHQAQEQAKRDENPAWRWRLEYSFTRYSSGRGSQKDFLLGVKEAIFKQQYEQWTQENIQPVAEADKNLHFFKLLQLAARWAELEERSKTNQSSN